MVELRGKTRESAADRKRLGDGIPRHPARVDQLLHDHVRGRLVESEGLDDIAEADCFAVALDEQLDDLDHPTGRRRRTCHEALLLPMSTIRIPVPEPRLTCPLVRQPE